LSDFVIKFHSTHFTLKSINNQEHFSINVRINTNINRKNHSRSIEKIEIAGKHKKTAQRAACVLAINI